ncbi:hypothetical protein EDD98_1381 [Streptomyces sp. PanSC19]|uniref:hypothetical protein n=1 Tax=Streptomyces sp. PanSC19 TaxID=1520455 RepID=UPI000F49FEB8|nr:hypothetical protein [Streptomyces sp. PanSC19]ROQ32397.1 hypothetical protein EDD98_1381 [Streptomyces sp. PanSC19]
MLRLRITVATWPRRALILADTPRPDCRECGGEGGWNRDYGDYETGEYAGTEWDPCPCWDEDRRWTLLPLPRLPRRRTPAADPWGDEPPF